ncbi:MAG: hypothetical protein LAP21_24280 [Acidobacteriia bacterium]|nr:hypothetical protein [Terriglobia bacterium]
MVRKSYGRPFLSNDPLFNVFVAVVMGMVAVWASQAAGIRLNARHEHFIRLIGIEWPQGTDAFRGGIFVVQIHVTGFAPHN